MSYTPALGTPGTYAPGALPSQTTELTTIAVGISEL